MREHISARHVGEKKNSFIVDIIITNIVIQEKSRNGATDGMMWTLGHSPSSYKLHVIYVFPPSEM